jgi:hypothetical protein
LCIPHKDACSSDHRARDAASVKPCPTSTGLRVPAAVAYLFGIIALLLLIIAALAGGIIWYNARKSNELAIAAAERMMVEVGNDISDRIKLLYDPIYAIVGIAAVVPELTLPAIKESWPAMSPMLRVLRIYPQVLSFYVGFDNGEFFMVAHIAGENAASLRNALNAPQQAAFANEVISAAPDGTRTTRWVFLADDDGVVRTGQEQ